jgi:dynein heavy chain
VKKFFAADFDRLFVHADINGDGKVDTLEEVRQIMFGDYLVPGADPRMYNEVSELKKLEGIMQTYLEDYNAQSTTPMRLVLFSYVMEHVSRVSRILKIPGGNALMVGVGGSGRKSATKLASYIAECELIEIEISKQYGMVEWREDLKRVLRQSGGDGKQTTFLFSDSQIAREAFVEDINNILNSGEVPNIFPNDEKAVELEKCQKAAKIEGRKIESPTEAYSYFLERVKSNLHIVLAFSPIGDAFRSRLRRFPSLVNCCTINWFTPWPNDALVTVARSFLEEIDVDAKIKESCVQMCMYFHKDVASLASRFYDELRRYYYATPTSYLELITTFKELFKIKRGEVIKAKGRYTNGLTKLVETEAAVEVMKKELIDLQPVLIQSTKDTERMMEIVAKETVDAEVIKKVRNIYRSVYAYSLDHLFTLIPLFPTLSLPSVALLGCKL